MRKIGAKVDSRTQVLQIRVLFLENRPKHRAQKRETSFQKGYLGLRYPQELKRDETKQKGPQKKGFESHHLQKREKKIEKLELSR
mmetsp:Transcript_43200/g.60602  ORF Transcript_43200/g.60602 Transcript_43200/m.60602 type:complete len:85 (-) Transcript_43200:276-530(-)